MKTKQIFTLGVVLLILIIAIILKQQQRPAELAQKVYGPLDLSFDASRVARIDIARFDKETGEEGGFTEFYKEGSLWRGSALWNARINESKIKEFLDEIQDAAGELRGQNKDLFPDFGITNNESFRIILEDDQGTGLLTFRIGNKKTRNGSIFIRKEGEAAVYLTDADLFGKMGIFGDPKEASPNQMHWASTQMVIYDSAKVNRLETRRYDDQGNETLTTSVFLDNGQWQYTRPGRPFELDGEKITKFLDAVKTWNSQAVADPEDEQHGLDKPTYQLTLGFEEGEDITITGGQPHEDSRSFPMKPSNEPVVYPLTVFYYENMDIDDSRFFKDNPFNVEKEKLEKLVIRADKEERIFTPKEKSWKELDDYIDQTLKNFRVERMIFDPKEAKNVKSPSAYFLEILREGDAAPQYLDAGKAVDEASREYAAQLRNGTDPFIVDSSTRRKLFEELDKLAEPPAEATPEAEEPAST